MTMYVAFQHLMMMIVLVVAIIKAQFTIRPVTGLVFHLYRGVSDLIMRMQVTMNAQQ